LEIYYLREKKISVKFTFKKNENFPNYFQFSLLPSGENFAKIKIKIITAMLG
jgi:hypothetical protein